MRCSRISLNPAIHLPCRGIALWPSSARVPGTCSCQDGSERWSGSATTPRVGLHSQLAVVGVAPGSANTQCPKPPSFRSMMHAVVIPPTQHHPVSRAARTCSATSRRQGRTDAVGDTTPAPPTRSSHTLERERGTQPLRFAGPIADSLASFTFAGFTAQANINKTSKTRLRGLFIGCWSS